MSLSILPSQSCALKEQSLAFATLDPKASRLLPTLKDIDGSILKTQIWGPISLPIGLNPQLKQLHLKECNVTPAMLAIIRKTFFSLTTVQITNDRLDEKTLIELTSIKRLELTYCRISSKALSQFSKFYCLKKLILISNSFENCQLTSLLGLKLLTNLKADSCRINGIGIKIIAQLTGLKTLSLADNGLNDHRITALAHLKNLTDLDLSHNCDIVGEGLVALTSLRLERLELVHCPVINGKAFEAMTDLTFLNLFTSFSQVAYFSGLTNLTDLTHPADLDGEDLQGLSLMTNLVSLDLEDAFLKLDHASQLNHFSALINLNTLLLKDIQFQGEPGSPSNLEESLVLTRALAKLKQLNVLSLTLGSFNQEIAQNLDKLTLLSSFTLILKDMNVDGGITRLCSECLNLTSLQLKNCTLKGRAQHYLQELGSFNACK